MALRQFGAAAAAVTVALALATPAHAVTEIQWWHAMTGANNDVVNKLAADFNASQKDYKVVADLQGLLCRHDERRHRRVPRRQRAAHHAGVRGRHRDDDGRQGRDQAGARDDEGSRRERSIRRPTCRPSPATTRPPRARCCRFPFNSSSTVMWVNKDALQEGRPRPEIAEDLARSVRCGQEAEGRRLRHLRLLQRLDRPGCIIEQFSRLAQRADRHQGQRPRRLRHRAQVQLARCTSSF